MLFIIRNNLFPSNTYIQSNKFRECIIFDPGLNYSEIDNKIIENKLKPLAIICTHGHFDHIASVSFFKKKYGIPFYLHQKDLKIAKSANFFLKLAKLDFWIDFVEPDVLFLEEYEELSLSNFCLQVYNYPGHSDGSCIIKYENSLFTGDIIYKNGLGFNNFPGENRKILKSSILRLLESFEPEVVIYPGHGNFEVLGKILEGNKELSEFVLMNQ